MLTSRRRRAWAALLAASLGAVLIAFFAVRPAPSTRPEDDLVAWLEERSLLAQARRASLDISGKGAQWQHPYGRPRPHDAVRRASVWLLDYPGSVVPRPGESVISTWGDPGLWRALRQVHVDLLHTGPLSRAGGVEGREYTPTLDGWFDRISLDLDLALGSEEEYARMVEVARGAGASIAGDLVPLHTGTGPDFWLALRAYKDYPGMYTMVEVAREHWPLQPEVSRMWGLALVPRPATAAAGRGGR